MTTITRNDNQTSRRVPHSLRGNRPASSTEVKTMLREIALVLHLTQKVKAEILRDRAELGETDSTPELELACA